MITKMPIGRGGAGNIEAVEHENARVAADLEASQSSADNYLNSALSSGYTKSQQQQSPHIHTGRGGAGNFSERHQTEQVPASGLAGRVPKQSTSARPSYGRGGAGNHEQAASFRNAEASKQQQGEQLTREQLKQQIEKSVKESLAMPPKAKVAGSEPY